jgi:hypothetical protein
LPFNPSDHSFVELMKGLVELARQPLRSAAVKVVNLFSTDQRDVAGIRILSFLDGSARVHFDKVEAALRLIGRHDPDRFEGIRRARQSILVMSMGENHPGRSSPATRLIILSADTLALASTSKIEVAVTIVHEAMHQRVWDAGIRVRDPRIRGRVERLCASAEIAFLQRVPSSEDLLRLSRWRATLPDEYWTEEREVRRIREITDRIGVRSPWPKLGRLVLGDP